MSKDPLSRLEERLCHRFADRGLLLQALTHSSRKNDLCCSNERMEFLGDAILGVVVSDFLYRNFPEHAEGELTQVKSVVVSRPTLADVAHALSIGECLMVAKGVARALSGEREDGAAQDRRDASRVPDSLLSDAFEAITAAVCLDAGFQAAKEFVLRHLEPRLRQAFSAATSGNFKSLLQQHIQKTMGATPTYAVTSETGPDHVKSFQVVAVINGKRYGAGRGRTKKAAEQMAACDTLAMLGQSPDVQNERGEMS